MVEFSFVCDSNAEASYLAQELEAALRREGIPTAKLSLRQSSSENMDAGSILSFAGDMPHMLGSLGYIACFAKCIYEVITEHHRTIVIENKDGSKVRICAFHQSWPDGRRALLGESSRRSSTFGAG
jgi:hypothetical protein